MKTTVESPESWSFDIQEVPAGVYRLVAKHPTGRRVELTGADPDALTKQAKSAIAEMN